MTPPPPSRGVQALFSTVSIAHDASIRPKPHSSFHRSETLGSLAEPRASDELRRISLISWGSREGSACNISATIPDAMGVAMLVPSFSS